MLWGEPRTSHALPPAGEGWWVGWWVLWTTGREELQGEPRGRVTNRRGKKVPEEQQVEGVLEAKGGPPRRQKQRLHVSRGL